ncbi:hypothetical protein [Methylobacterium crusticola]|uniref:hypothetical protein n=1 Tax=Methylobacterium crusticola TaxID=1697972 RepID=UPI001FD442F2|nr:hypothetical protein [Methylobacterium crusticola]
MLALTASGFAGYGLAAGARPYAVQAVLPARAGPFPWKRSVAEGRAALPDLDPLTTGSLPDRAAPAAAPPAAEPAAPPAGAYALRQAAPGSAVVEGRDGLRRIAVGAVLPGAGRVLAIRSTGAGWIVVTTETIIGPSPL